MINVTKTYLPSFDNYISILKRAWDKEWITNNGELVRELEQKLKEYHDTEFLLFCGNGTIVLQMALKALGISRQVITTPFSYVATTNSILWEGCTPVFVDIDPETLCIDANRIEDAITKETEAILATHVYGLPCNVEKIESIARRYNLKVIYDAAHAFGCTYKGKSLLSYGDVSTCSFHATKIFHTVEGGCIISHDEELNKKLFLYRGFGHIGDDYYSIGINGKNSEFHAAMGLAILPEIPFIIEERRKLFEAYDSQLPSCIQKVNNRIDGFEYNYSYYPVIFKTESDLLSVRNNLQSKEVNTRRYFHPSLNLLPHLTEKQPCRISEDISSRVLCLPLYPGLTESDLAMICNTVKQSLQCG
jgi:dTDP-4-amino-4,6-dideoxygalactose transaminase